MNSEKVKEIKKALEDNANGSEHTHLAYIEDYMVKLVAYRDILTLINELESENERLNKALVDNLEAYKDGFNEGAGLKKGVDNKLKTENKQLKDRIAELEKEIEENAFYSKGYAQGIKNTYEVVIPDKLKQFTEKVAKRLININGIKEILDETLKEFIDAN